MKKFLSLMLALAMVFSLAACGGNADTSNPPEGGNTEGPNNGSGLAVDNQTEIDQAAYEDESWDLYDEILGEFNELLAAGQKETHNLSLRYALLAQAEAKLDELGLFALTTNDGSRFAFSRVVPRSDTQTTWGLDEYRFGYTLVADTFLTPDERAELTELWSEAETATDYHAAAKAWLADKGYGTLDAYRYGLTEGPVTWDVLATSLQLDGEYIAPTYSPLLRYDGKNQLQPCLAESYEISEDGMTYTFHIRQGVKWVDQQGRELADVTAHDWVTGMHHLTDFSQELGYLMEEGYANIENWSEFLQGEVTFDQVGVEAVDDYTLVYHLTADTPYFPTMLGYGCFAPLNEEYFLSQGGGFGSDFDFSAASYVYGTDPSHIAYCGEFLVDNYTDGSVCHYVANDHYWDYEHLNIHELYITWYDGADVMAVYNGAMAGTFSGHSLTTSTLVQAKKDMVEATGKSVFDSYVYVSLADTTSRQVNYNLNRHAWANFNDSSKAVSPQTVEDAQRTNAAMNNINFRLAITFAFERGSYNAVLTGEDMKYNSLDNTFVPGDFVQLTEDVTLDLGGGATKTFPAGTFYGEIVDAQFKFDGFEADAWDPEGADGLGASYGFDGWYKPEAAKARLETAIAELAEEGVEISADNPIYLDLPYWSSNENYTSRGNIYKKSIETVLDGAVIVNLIPCETTDDWYSAGYFTNYGYQNNFDLWDLSGWGPDFQDPTSYLNCYLADYSGYLTKSSGIF